MNRRAIGTWGEAQVAEYLRKRGYEILASSYHCVYGEIDLIAKKKKTLCFYFAQGFPYHFLFRFLFNFPFFNIPIQFHAVNDLLAALLGQIRIHIR